MPNLGDLVVRVVGDNSELDKALTASEKKFKTFSDSMTKVGKGLSLFVTAPLIAAGIAALKSAGQFQLFQTSFETMLGDASKAKKLINDLQTLAAATPFKMDDLAKGAQVLLQYGVTSEKLLPIIRQLGDVAQGDSEKFNRLTLAFGQTQSTGRLMGQDLLQMINSGFNPLMVISQKTGRSMADLKAAMEKGAISADMVADAFATATSEGGMFFQGMEKASKTLPGLISTLSDDIGAMGRSFATLLMPAVMDTVKRLSELAKSFTEMDASTKKAIMAFAGVLAVAGPLLVIIPKVMTAIRTMSTAFATSVGPIGLVVAGVALLVAGIVKIIGLSKEFAEKQKLMDDATKGNLKSTEEYNLAIGLMGDKTRELAEQKAELQKAVSGELKITKNLADTASMLGQAQSALSIQGREESARKVKALEAEMAAQNAAVAAATKNRDKLTAQENAAAAAASKKAEADAKAAAAEAERAALAAAALKEREDGIKAVRDALAEAGKDEAAIIDGEIAKLKEWGFADADIMAYMKLTHKEFYEKDVEDQTVSLYKLEAGERDYAERIANLQAKELAEKDKKRNDDEEKEKESKDRQLSDWLGYGQRVLDIISQLFSAIDSARQRDLAKQIAAIDKATGEQLAAVDERMQAELWAKGLVEAKTEEQYRTEIAAALAAGDAERAAALQKSLDILLITETFEAEKTAIEAAAAKKKALLEYNAALASWRMQLTLGIADAAMAVLNGLLTKPFVPAGIIAGVLAGALGGIQIAAIAAAKPQMPSLAEGGIALPTPGGRVVNVAEAGEAEGIIPISQLDRMLSRSGAGGGSGDTGDIHLVVKIDSKPILDQIFPATRNRTVLVDARAVVA